VRRAAAEQRRIVTLAVRDDGDTLVGMRAAMLIAVALLGCGAGSKEPPSTPATHVTVPAWVEGPVDETSGAPASKSIAPAATFATQKIGSAPSVKKYSGRRIDLDVVNADLHEVCRLLADVGKINIVVADDVTGSVTIKMKQVPWDQALDAILRAKGYASERDGNVVTVYAP
jgi:hypothetical protein